MRWERYPGWEDVQNWIPSRLIITHVIDSMLELDGWSADFFKEPEVTINTVYKSGAQWGWDDRSDEEIIINCLEGRLRLRVDETSDILLTDLMRLVEYAKIRSAKVLSGSVIDQSGSAIPGVQVSEMSDEWRDLLRSTTTDAQGGWSLDPFVSGKTYCIEFAKPNFSFVRMRVKITKQGDGVVFVEMPVASQLS